MLNIIVNTETGLTNTPNFAQEYRRNVAESILGHGYFKEKRLSPISIVKSTRRI